MTIAELIIHLRKQLIELRGTNNRQAIAELLSTFKMLTKASFESGDKDLTAILVDLTDSARDMFMGKPLNGKVPTEEAIYAVMSAPVANPETTRSVAPAIAESLRQDVPLEIRPRVSKQEEETAPLPDSAVIEDVIDDTGPIPEDPEQTMIQQLQEVAALDWTNHREIRLTSDRQMSAYDLLHNKLELFETLSAYSPSWVGDFPLGIDTERSEIKIICEASNLRDFLTDLKTAYVAYQDFKVVWKAVGRVPSIVGRFHADGFTVQVFGQGRPIREQESFHTLCIFAKLLVLAGHGSRDAIRERMMDGATPEEAFTAHLKLDGDPAQVIRELSLLNNKALYTRVTRP